MGHSDASSLRRIISLDNLQVSDAKLKAVIQTCPCQRDTHVPNILSFPFTLPHRLGECLFMGVFYLDLVTPSQFPPVLIVDDASRFILPRFIPLLKPIALLSVLIEDWLILFRSPSEILADKGTHFSRAGWQPFTHIHDVNLTCAPTGAPH